jgi:hypothetical protein
MNDGTFETRVADGPAGSYCVRKLGLDGWSGCDYEATWTEKTYVTRYTT